MDSRIESAARSVGAPVIEEFRDLAAIRSLAIQTLRELVRLPWRGKEIFSATVQIGIGSLPIVTVSTAFAGLVVSNEIAWHMKLALHSITMIPGFTGQFVIRELAIAIPALLVVAKVGAAITAEVSTMKVTEQVDALRLLKISPVTYLVFPRWIACMISLACLTLISIFVTIVFAMTSAVIKFGFNSLEYLTILQKFVEPIDVLFAMIKAVVFGSVIPVIACAYGLRCREGAEGVGSATTNAVVTSTIAVIILDFCLTFVFSTLK